MRGIFWITIFFGLVAGTYLSLLSEYRQAMAGSAAAPLAGVALPLPRTCRLESWRLAGYWGAGDSSLDAIAELSALTASSGRR